MLSERLARFISTERGPQAQDSFEELALAVFADLCERDPDYRAAAARAGSMPDSVADWRAIPVAAADAGDSTARGSLGQTALEAAFRSSCLAGLNAPPILGLGDNLESLVAGFGGPGSRSAATDTRLDAGAARSWLAARQRDRRAAVVLASPAAGERLLGVLERQDLRFRLAVGSRLVLIGDAPDQAALAGAAALAHGRLAIDPGAVLVGLSRPRGVTPLFAPCSGSGRLDPAATPPWVRYRALDPTSGEELSDGVEGSLSVLDLSVEGPGFHRMTGLAGSVAGGSVWVAGAVA